MKKFETAFEVNELDRVFVQESELFDGGDGDIDNPDEEDGGIPERITVTFTGKAVDEIIDGSERFDISTGEYIRKCMKLGRLSVRANRGEIIDFRFETYFHEDDLY